MNNLIFILKDDYATIILCLFTYILFRIINRFKYKKKINIKKECILFLFIIYILILFRVVTYPVNEYGKNNYIIFSEIKRYKLGSNLFIQNIVGNIILFIPYGMFFKSYFDLKLLSLIIVTIIYSFAIETMQLLIGRVFDIDDIILNLIGSIIGYYYSKYSI